MQNDFINTKPSPKTAGLLYSLMIAVYVLFNAIFGSIFGYLYEQNYLLYTTISSTVTLVVLVGLIAVFAIFNGGAKGLIEYPRLKKFNPIYLVAVLLLSVGMFFGFGFVNNLIAKWFNLTSPTIIIDSPLTFVGYTVVLAVMPAFSEEVFFRGGLLYNCKQMGAITKSLIIALMFAFFHGNLAQFVYQFIYGVGLTILAEKCGSVIPSMLVHFVNNFLILAFNYFGVVIDFFAWWIIVIGLVVYACFWVMIIFFQRKRAQEGENVEKADKKENQKQSLQMLGYGAIGFLISVVLIVLGLL